MGESVTPGPLGGIPATTNVYTAAQVDALVATLNSTLSGITEEGWSALSDIISGVETFATKSGLAKIISVQSGADCEINHSSGEGGVACSGVYYFDGSEKIRLLDAAMFGEGGVCGIVSGVRLASELSQYYSQEDISMYLDLGTVANRILGGSEIVTPERAASMTNMLDAFLLGYEDAMSGSGGSGVVVPVLLPSGTSLCDAVSVCISGAGVITSGNICDYVSGCISGMGINWAAVNNAISGLQNAVCGLTGRISGMVDGLALVIADALTAADSIIEHEELPDEIKRKVQRARDKANDPVVFPVIRDDVKREVGADILNDIVPALDDVKDAVSDGVAVDPNDPDLPPDTPIDVEDVAAADTTAGDTAENASDASDALSSENGNLEQYGRSLL